MPSGNTTANLEVTRLELISAARQGNLAKITGLKNSGLDLLSSFEEGFNLLFIAVQNKQSHLIEPLINWGLNPNGQNQEGDLPLFCAIDLKDTATTSALLAGGAKPDLATAEGITALHLACQFNAFEILSLFLAVKPKLDCRTDTGATALYIAVNSGNDKLVRLLLKAGADPLLPLYNGSTPIDAAILHAHREVIDLLAAYPCTPSLAWSTPAIMNRLDKLVLSQRRVDEEDVLHFSTALAENTTLKHLDFCSEENPFKLITPAGLRAVANAMTKNSTLISFKCLPADKECLESLGALKYIAYKCRENQLVAHSRLSSASLVDICYLSIFRNNRTLEKLESSFFQYQPLLGRSPL